MMNVGLQMYTVRDECEKDFIGTLKKVAAIGYDGVEFCAYYGIGAIELRKYIDELGLKAVNAHVSFVAMQEDFEKEIAYAKILGMKTLTIPWMPPEYRKDVDTYLKTFDLVKDLCEKCSEEGIQLSYHNHDFEFIKIGNEYALDVLMNQVSDLKMELDTFWTSYIGIDTLEYMKKNATRLQYIHLKDMIKGDQPQFAEIGEGCLDISSFVKTAAKLGVEWAFVEQDSCLKPSIECVKTSYVNLKRMLADG